VSDEEIRSKERHGHVDVAAILRASSDAPGREALLSLAAGLGHEEALRWVEELCLKEVGESAEEAWTGLPPRRQLEWLCDCVESVVRALKRQGGDPGEGTPAAIALVRRRVASDDLELQEERRVFALLEREGPEFRRRADVALRGGDNVASSLAWIGSALGLNVAGEAIRATRSSKLREGLIRAVLERLEGAAADVRLISVGGNPYELPRDPRRQSAAEEYRAWRLAQLRDSYLWPEAIRPPG